MEEKIPNIVVNLSSPGEKEKLQRNTVTSPVIGTQLFMLAFTSYNGVHEPINPTSVIIAGGEDYPKSNERANFLLTLSKSAIYHIYQTLIVSFSEKNWDSGKFTKSWDRFKTINKDISEADTKSGFWAELRFSRGVQVTIYDYDAKFNASLDLRIEIDGMDELLAQTVITNDDGHVLRQRSVSLADFLTEEFHKTPFLHEFTESGEKPVFSTPPPSVFAKTVFYPYVSTLKSLSPIMENYSQFKESMGMIEEAIPQKASKIRKNDELNIAIFHHLFRIPFVSIPKQYIDGHRSGYGFSYLPRSTLKPRYPIFYANTKKIEQEYDVIYYKHDKFNMNGDPNICELFSNVHCRSICQCCFPRKPLLAYMNCTNVEDINSYWEAYDELNEKETPSEKEEEEEEYPYPEILRRPMPIPGKDGPSLPIFMILHPKAIPLSTMYLLSTCNHTILYTGYSQSPGPWMSASALRERYQTLVSVIEAIGKSFYLCYMSMFKVRLSQFDNPQDQTKRLGCSGLMYTDLKNRLFEEFCGLYEIVDGSDRLSLFHIIDSPYFSFSSFGFMWVKYLNEFCVIPAFFPYFES
ncbi:hypothetical protein ADUPG1_012540, partial [Aduncisulcus paluster]